MTIKGSHRIRPSLMMIYNFDYRNKSEWPEGEFLKWYISHDENNY